MFLAFKMRLLSFVIFAFLPAASETSVVDPLSAGAVASVQVRIMNARKGYGQTYALRSSEPVVIEASAGILAYVCALDPEGFVVVTADTKLTPVIAYCEHGSFSLSEDNPLLDILRADISRRLKALDLGLISQRRIEANQRRWMEFLSCEESASTAGESWPPAGQTLSGGWIESAWTQGSPYNDSCPMDPVTNVVCLAGCPAVTMGQIISFWQYPDSVIFKDEDSYTSDYLGRTIPIDAPAASIPVIDYNHGDPSGGVCADIAYACGVSTQSVYTSQVSGVFTNSWCAHGLLEHFGFSTAEFRTGDGGDFYDVLEKNMKDSMPAIIVIVGEIGGHTLVCDGFRQSEDEEGEPEWHLNFGWGPYQPKALASCWYVIPDSLPLGLTTLVEAVVNIEAPRRPQPASVNEKSPMKLSDLRCDPLVFKNHTVINYSLIQNSYVEIGIWDASGSKVLSLENEFQTAGNYSLSWDGKDESGRTLPAGVYFVRLMADKQRTGAKILLLR